MPSSSSSSLSTSNTSPSNTTFSNSTPSSLQSQSQQRRSQRPNSSLANNNNNNNNSNNNNVANGTLEPNEDEDLVRIESRRFGQRNADSSGGGLNNNTNNNINNVARSLQREDDFNNCSSIVPLNRSSIVRQSKSEEPGDADHMMSPISPQQRKNNPTTTTTTTSESTTDDQTTTNQSGPQGNAVNNGNNQKPSFRSSSIESSSSSPSNQQQQKHQQNRFHQQQQRAPISAAAVGASIDGLLPYDRFNSSNKDLVDDVISSQRTSFRFQQQQQQQQNQRLFQHPLLNASHDDLLPAVLGRNRVLNSSVHSVTSHQSIKSPQFPLSPLKHTQQPQQQRATPPKAEPIVKNQQQQHSSSVVSSSIEKSERESFIRAALQQDQQQQQQQEIVQEELEQQLQIEEEAASPISPLSATVVPVSQQNEENIPEAVKQQEQIQKSAEQYYYHVPVQKKKIKKKQKLPSYPALVTVIQLRHVSISKKKWNAHSNKISKIFVLIGVGDDEDNVFRREVGEIDNNNNMAEEEHLTNNRKKIEFENFSCAIPNQQVNPQPFRIQVIGRTTTSSSNDIDHKEVAEEKEEEEDISLGAKFLASLNDLIVPGYEDERKPQKVVLDLGFSVKCHLTLMNVILQRQTPANDDDDDEEEQEISYVKDRAEAIRIFQLNAKFDVEPEKADAQENDDDDDLLEQSKGNAMAEFSSDEKQQEDQKISQPAAVLTSEALTRDATEHVASAVSKLRAMISQSYMQRVEQQRQQQEEEEAQEYQKIALVTDDASKKKSSQASPSASTRSPPQPLHMLITIQSLCGPMHFDDRMNVIINLVCSGDGENKSLVVSEFREGALEQFNQLCPNHFYNHQKQRTSYVTCCYQYKFANSAAADASSVSRNINNSKSEDEVDLSSSGDSSDSKVRKEQDVAPSLSALKYFLIDYNKLLDGKCNSLKVEIASTSNGFPSTTFECKELLLEIEKFVLRHQTQNHQQQTESDDEQQQQQQEKVKKKKTTKHNSNLLVLKLKNQNNDQGIVTVLNECVVSILVPTRQISQQQQQHFHLMLTRKEQEQQSEDFFASSARKQRPLSASFSRYSPQIFSSSQRLVRKDQQSQRRLLQQFDPSSYLRVTTQQFFLKEPRNEILITVPCSVVLSSDEQDSTKHVVRNKVAFLGSSTFSSDQTLNACTLFDFFEEEYRTFYSFQNPNKDKSQGFRLGCAICSVSSSASILVGGFYFQQEQERQKHVSSHNESSIGQHRQNAMTRKCFEVLFSSSSAFSAFSNNIEELSFTPSTHRLQLRKLYELPFPRMRQQVLIEPFVTKKTLISKKVVTFSPLMRARSDPRSGDQQQQQRQQGESSNGRKIIPSLNEFEPRAFASISPISSNSSHSSSSSSSLLLVGGITSKGVLLDETILIEYNNNFNKGRIISNARRQKPLPNGRAAHVQFSLKRSAGSHNDASDFLVIVFGGLVDTVLAENEQGDQTVSRLPDNSTFILSAEEWKTFPSSMMMMEAPSPRFGHSCSVLKNSSDSTQAVIFGGFTFSPSSSNFSAKQQYSSTSSSSSSCVVFQPVPSNEALWLFDVTIGWRNLSFAPQLSTFVNSCCEHAIPFLTIQSTSTNGMNDDVLMIPTRKCFANGDQQQEKSKSRQQPEEVDNENNILSHGGTEVFSCHFYSVNLPEKKSPTQKELATATPTSSSSKFQMMKRFTPSSHSSSSLPTPSNFHFSPVTSSSPQSSSVHRHVLMLERSRSAHRF